MKLNIRLFLVLTALLTSAYGFSQNTLAPGLPVLGSPPGDAFHSFEYDRVDTQNGNVLIDIPLYALPQLGTLKLSFSIKANSAGWAEAENCDSYGDCGAYYGLPFNSPGSNQPLSPSVALDQDISPIAIAEEYWWDQDASPNTNPQYYLGLWVQEPDASLHSLAMDLSDQTHLRARSTDGSGYMELYSNSTPGVNGQSGIPVVYNKDGTSFTWNSTYTQELIADRNGNTIARTINNATSQARGSITDSLLRIFDDPTGTGYSSTTTGCPATPTTALNQPLIGSYIWTPPAPGGSASYQFIFCYATIGLRTNFFQEPDASAQCEAFQWYCQEYSSTKVVLQSVVLPNGTAWQFTYDSANLSDPTSVGFGQVQQLLLPTGGSISYNYTNKPQCSTGQVPVYTRKLITRTINDGLGHTAVWNYDIGLGKSVVHSPEVDQPSGGQGSNDTVITYSGTGTTCAVAETQEDVYQGSATASSNPIRTKKITYLTAAAPHPELNYFDSNSFVLPQTKTTVIPGVGQSITTMSYGTSFSTAVFEWLSNPSTWPVWTTIYGPTTQMPFGDVTSTTVTDFDGSTVLSTNVMTPLWTTNGMYTSPYYLANLLSLPSNASISGFGNSAETDYGYDDPSCSPGGPHGNQTSVGKYSNIGATDFTTKTCYNVAGMPTKTIDANGNASGTNSAQHATTITYDSTDLFLSSVQQPTTSGVAHTDYYSFDFNTGNMLWHTDQNGNAPSSGVPDAGHTTHYTYDAIGRLIDVQYPQVPEGQPESKLCYTDLGGSICSKTHAPFSAYISTSASPDPAIVAFEQYDGLGRPTISTLLSDPQGPQVTQTIYDGVGRVASTTNPYTSTTESTYDVTRYIYDAIGRKVIEARQKDGTSTSWLYDKAYATYPGSGTVFTDEVGNTTTNVSDALGRLKYVVDAKQSPTSYSYDVLGNLTGVSQPGDTAQGVSSRIRSFVYDSLSRLVCASNPESASAPCTASALSGYISGTLGYTYDPNGNVISRTDASGVTIKHTYDFLNRRLSTTYISDTSGTPSSCYSYDGATTSNLVGRLAQEWTQSGQCSSNPPAGSTISSRTGVVYDAMGRLRSYQQCAMNFCSAANPLQVQQTYDLAGNLSKLIQVAVPNLFPTLQLSSNYDGAGRLSSVESNWDSTPHPKYPLRLYTVQSYSPVGPTAWSLGGGILNFQKAYDSRERPVTEVVTH